MKQLTTGQLPTLQSEVHPVHGRQRRGRSVLSGFAFAIGRSETRRRMFDSLRPEGGFIPLDLEMIEVVTELDSGMIDWQGRETSTRIVS